MLLSFTAFVTLLLRMHVALARAPEDLSNFQGIYACDLSVNIGRPRSYIDVGRLIHKYKRVKATGEGHSWWQESFCSGDDSESVNIITSSLTSRIHVDEEKQTVQVSAGVITRDLLDYLDRYRPSSYLPLLTMGYTLPAFPWYIDQSIGGAVATASHGSSMMHGTLSKQTVGMTVALANGTISKVTRESHPHLMRALLCNVGRLGIILDLELKITPNNPVRRQKTDMSGESFVAQMKSVQQAYNQGGENTKEVQALGQSELFWFFANDKASKWHFDELDASVRTASYSVLLNANAAVRSQLEALIYANSPYPDLSRVTPDLVEGFAEEWVGTAGEAGALVESGKVPAVHQFDPVSNFILEWLAPSYNNNFYENILNMVNPVGIFNRRDSYLAETEISAYLQRHMGVYDQYEVAVPMETVGDCFEELRNQMNAAGTALSQGFPIPGLVRFVASEDAYLSPVEGAPRVYLNIEDYFSKSRRYNSNPDFMVAMRILRGPKCRGRLHWGKAGWPTFASDFDGAREYPTTWCHFGCAVRELDPVGKFQSLAHVWNWEGIDLESCCTSDGGFSSACACARS